MGDGDVHPAPRAHVRATQRRNVDRTSARPPWLEPYGAFEIKHSSWIRQLERMNSVHPHHSPEPFEWLRHYVLSFRDTTFECVAHGFDYKTELLSDAVAPAIGINVETDRVLIDEPDLADELKRTS